MHSVVYAFINMQADDELGDEHANAYKVFGFLFCCMVVFSIKYKFDRHIS